MLSIIPSDFFLSRNSVKLARLVKFVEFPALGHHDPPYQQAPDERPIVRGQYTRQSHGESSAGFATKLTSFMSSGFSKRTNTRVRIETQAVKTYTLDNSEAWFEEATSFDETRRWIERALGGDGIYFVIGFHTVTDARIVHETIEGHQLSGEVALPVGLSFTAVGVAPLGNIIDPGVAGYQRVLDGAKTQFIVPGEQICAFQYRKISYRWLHSKKINNLTLAKLPRWTATENWRKSSVEDAEKEPDVLEVEVDKLEEPEGDWEREEHNGEVLLIHSVEASDEF